MSIININVVKLRRAMWMKTLSSVHDGLWSNKTYYESLNEFVDHLQWEFHANEEFWRKTAFWAADAMVGGQF